MPALFRALVFALILPVSLSSQGLKLNEPLARPIGGDVEGFVVSPDGTRVAYVADQDSDDVFEIFSVAADGSGSPVKLNVPLTGALDVYAFDLAFSPDGARILFTVLEYFVEARLWSAPSDGSLPAKELGEAYGHVIAPAGARVVALGDFQTEGEFGLFSLPIDGSGPPLRLNAPLPPGGSVRVFDELCVITRDGATVLYVAEQDVDGRDELYAAPIDGSAPPTKLNGALVAGGDVGLPGPMGMPMGIGAGDRVVYVADQEQDERYELFSVPLDGSAPPVKLSAPLVAGGDVAGNDVPFVLSPDRSRVLYVADAEIDEAFGLHVVPIDGSQPSQPLTPGVAAGRRIEQYGFAPGGAHACFIADLRESRRFELFRAPLTGPGVPRLLSGELVTGGDVRRFELTPDGRWIVYAADQESDGVFALYRVEVDTRLRARSLGVHSPGAPVKISGEIDLSAYLPNFELTSDGRVVFGTTELYVVPLAGHGAPELLAAGYTGYTGFPSDTGTGAVLTPLQLAGTKRVVFLHTDEPADHARELYSVPVDGSLPAVRLSKDLPVGPVLGDVFGCDFSPRGDWVVYEADGDIDGLFELYVASTSGRKPTRKLNGALEPVVWLRRYHPDGERIAFHASAPGASELLPYLARLDGTAPPAILGGPYPAGRSVGVSAFTDGGTRMLLTGDLDTAGRRELYNAPVEGGAPRFKLNHALVGNEDVWNVLLSPDGLRVVYMVSPHAAPQSQRIWSVPLDRSEEPVALSQVGDGSLNDLSISPDGQHVVYRAFASSHELYGVPIDGSQPRTLLSPPLGSGAVTEYVIAPDSSRVVFLESTSTPSLRSVPPSGGTPVTLNPALGLWSYLSGGLVSSDSAAVVFSADGRLYRAPLDGSAPAHALNGPGGTGWDLHLASDGEYVVYRGEEVGVGAGILRVPIDGSAAPARISPDISPFADVTLELTPDGRDAVYATEGALPGADELFAVPVDGSRPARLLNDPSVEGGVVYDIDGPRFKISPISHAVIYRAERNGVKELYLSLLDRHALPASKPVLVR